MSAASRSRSRGLALIVALVALFAVAPAAHAGVTYGGPPTANGGTYLALGDSLAFGYQGVKLAGCWQAACATPDATNNTGYVDVFANLIAAKYPGVDTVNLGCPGETSSSLINDTNGTTGCTKYPFALHDNHQGKTQLQAAVDVLRSQGRKVNPVTLDIGANDVLATVRGCTDSTTGAINLACVQNNAPAAFASIQANVDSILNTLRLEGGKTKEIIVSGLYNPLFVAILQQTGDPVAAAGTDQLTAQLNGLLQQTATKYNAKFVNPLPTFNSANWGKPAFYQQEAGTVCATTLMCVDQTTAPTSAIPFPTLGPDGKADADIHASNAGYAAYGQLFMAAAGY